MIVAVVHYVHEVMQSMVTKFLIMYPVIPT